jgi:hypothetical protein
MEMISRGKETDLKTNSYSFDWPSETLMSKLSIEGSRWYRGKCTSPAFSLNGIPISTYLKTIHAGTKVQRPPPST